MYYYKKKGKDIIKYEVKIDEETLKKLRLEIIEKCSYIEHIKRMETDSIKSYRINFDHIRNYTEEYIRTIEYNDFYSMPEDEYLVEYDYYNYPLIIKYIDNLLNGNTRAIEQIKKVKDKTLDKEQELLNEQQNIINKLNHTTQKNKQEQIQLLNENQEKLLEYYKEKELNINQVSTTKYKNKVLKCIEFKEIEIISYKTVLEVIKFLCECNEKTMDNGLNKVLKLNL